MRIAARLVKTGAAVAVVLLGGCAPVPAGKDCEMIPYYLKTPAGKSFSYRFRAPDGSVIEGRVDVQVTEVVWPRTEDDWYEMKLAISKTMKGRFVGRDAAVRFAPRDAIRKALDPADAVEVFQQKPLSAEEIAALRARGVDISEKAEVTREVYCPDKIHRLRLPIAAAWSSPAPLESTSKLRGFASMASAAEVALVWLKCLRDELDMPMPGECKAMKTQIADGQLTVHLAVAPLSPSRATGGTYLCRFRKDQGLVAVHANLVDGIRIDLE